ncbi:hypothetical protein F5X68DRAFT_20690 [Plectosphaerella plurivora]|uniref:N-acetyltransferase domain-containing protein n=1 Tax=Plectosphaerella plurivora TaxID=936078 RepID=A0A9P9A9A1_9PEZI|nr:hypothetical protein F5X68DRAFT_20690 [Plectosphaerella plurivora]
MTVFRAPSSTGVALIPWDPTSEDHIQRLIEQRIECGWHEDMPAVYWKKLQLQGTKCIYWVVPQPVEVGAAEKLEAQMTPKQRVPLLDTCTTLRGQSLTPSKQPFIPVGHIALDMTHPAADALGFKKPTEGVIWIKSLFVLESLQSNGLARAAMDTLEAMLASEPLCAKTLLLDTMQKDDQIKLKAPKLTTQAWYERRGYRVIHVDPGFYNDTEVPEAKEFEGFVARTVFMQLDMP